MHTPRGLVTYGGKHKEKKKWQRPPLPQGNPSFHTLCERERHCTRHKRKPPEDVPPELKQQCTRVYVDVYISASQRLTQSTALNNYTLPVPGQETGVSLELRLEKHGNTPVYSAAWPPFPTHSAQHYLTLPAQAAPTAAPSLPTGRQAPLLAHAENSFATDTLDQRSSTPAGSRHCGKAIKRPHTPSATQLKTLSRSCFPGVFSNAIRIHGPPNPAFRSAGISQLFSCGRA